MVSAATHKLPISFVIADQFHMALPAKYMATTKHSQPPVLKPNWCIHQQLPSSAAIGETVCRESAIAARLRLSNETCRRSGAQCHHAKGIS
jgi:hypothetical protein